jgi:putative colanic acid biosynthesis glycosyltransferase WcaI
MRILVVTPFYAPDLGPSASLYAMLCEDLSRLGCEVSVISAVPHYPSGRVADGFRGRLVRTEELNGVKVTRVWVPGINRARLALRLLGFACYQALAAAVAFTRRYDVLIASGPAFEVFLPVLGLGILRRRQMIYSVHEIYPDVGVKLGIFRHRLVTGWVGWLERWCSNRASYVRVLSEGYRRALEAKGVPKAKLTVIGDWVDTDFIQPAPRHNAFSASWGLDDAFVVMHAGNLGLTQGLEDVVEAARRLARDPRICFAFVGDGAARGQLQAMVTAARLSNVRFIPFQPRALLPLVLASADVHLNALKRGFGTDSVPSKCYSIMAAGRPVIAAVDPDTDTWTLIQQADCGLTVPPGKPEALAGAVRELYENAQDRERLGANGRAYAVQHHSRTAAAEQFYRLARALEPDAPSKEAAKWARGWSR